MGRSNGCNGSSGGGSTGGGAGGRKEKIPGWEILNFLDVYILTVLKIL